MPVSNRRCYWWLAAIAAVGVCPAPAAAQFDGHWSRLDTNAAPPGRRAASAVYDSRRHRLIVFGGNSEHPNDVWALHLGTQLWQQVSPAGMPPSTRFGASAIYDVANDRLIVFGGHHGALQHDDVWQLSLAGAPAWRPLVPRGAGPAGRSFHMAVYDVRGRRMILFGGYDGSGFLGDTWELSLAGTPAWTRMTFIGPTPAGRDLAGVTVDLARERLVLFGGWSGEYRNDTWMLPLSGRSGWSEVAATHRPPPRREISIAYDASWDHVVLFGGNDGALRSDTWTLDLTGAPEWRKASPVSRPPPRSGHNTIYDPVGKRVVLFGGLVRMSRPGGNERPAHSNVTWALTDTPFKWN